MDVRQPPFMQDPPAPVFGTPLELRVRYQRRIDHAEDLYESHELTIPANGEAADTGLLARQWASLGHEPQNLEIVACTPSGAPVPIKRLINPIQFPCPPTSNQYNQLFAEARRARRYHAVAPFTSAHENRPDFAMPPTASHISHAGPHYSEQGHGIAPVAVRGQLTASRPEHPIATPQSAPAHFPVYPYRPLQHGAPSQDASEHAHGDQPDAHAHHSHFDHPEITNHNDVPSFTPHNAYVAPRTASQRAAINATGRRLLNKDPNYTPSSQPMALAEAAANRPPVSSHSAENESKIRPLSFPSKQSLNRPPSVQNNTVSNTKSPAAHPSSHVHEIRDSFERSESFSPPPDGSGMPLEALQGPGGDNPASRDGYRMFPRDREYLTDEVNRVLDAIENNFSGSNAKNPRRPIRISIYNELSRLGIKGHFGPRGDLLGGSSLRNYTLRQLGMTAKLWDYLDYKFGAGKTSREMVTKDGGKQSYRIQNRLTAAERRSLGQDANGDVYISASRLGRQKQDSREPKGKKRRLTESGQHEFASLEPGPRYSF